MAIFATAGTRIYIGSTVLQKSANFVVGDFASQSWVLIGWTENLGNFGDESSEIAFNAISEGRTFKLKGVRNAGSMALVMGVNTSDSGQDELRGAELTPDDYAFRVDFNDEPSNGTSPSHRYFIGKVMSVRETLDTVNNVVKLQATIGINSNIVIVDAV